MKLLISVRFRRQYSNQADRSTGIICDQSGMLTGFYSACHYLEKLRRIKYHDADMDKTLIFLTNNFSLPALTIAQLYRCRWQVELFFKWIKQNLRIKSFYGTSVECSENSNLDCRISLCAGRHTQEAAQHTSESLHNFTNSQRLGFRKNTVITTTYGSNTGTGDLRLPKPVEFIHLIVGK